MALSLDDRLLGERVENYCSSSEDEGQEDEDGERITGPKAPTFIPESQIKSTGGAALNVSPSGNYLALFRVIVNLLFTRCRSCDASSKGGSRTFSQRKVLQQVWRKGRAQMV